MSSPAPSSRPHLPAAGPFIPARTFLLSEAKDLHRLCNPILASALLQAFRRIHDACGLRASGRYRYDCSKVRRHERHRRPRPGPSLPADPATLYPDSTLCRLLARTVRRVAAAIR